MWHAWWQQDDDNHPDLQREDIPPCLVLLYYGHRPSPLQSCHHIPLGVWWDPQGAHGGSGPRPLWARSFVLTVFGETFHLAVVQVFSSLFSFYCDEISCVIASTPSPTTLMRHGCLPTVQWCMREISAQYSPRLKVELSFDIFWCWHTLPVLPVSMRFPLA